MNSGSKRNERESVLIESTRRHAPLEIGATTQFIDDAIKGGPEGVRAAQWEAKRLCHKFGVAFDANWSICTKWLKEWASGSLGTRANGLPLSNGAERRGERDSRVRVREAMAWRIRWLCAYAMSASKAMACRAARVGHSTADYHLKNDPDFAGQAEAAKEHAVDLLHARAFARCVEGDIEPVYWQGEVVGHIRKFDSRLQIQMLRAYRPEQFRAPGAQINVGVKNDVFVLSEEQRKELQRINRRRILRECQNDTVRPQVLTTSETTNSPSLPVSEHAGAILDQPEPTRNSSP